MKRIQELLGLNRLYFRSFTEVADRQHQRIRAKIMLDIGYDERRKKLIKNGWLYKIVNSTTVATEVAQLFSSAISGKQRIGAFKELFRNVVINPNGLGVTQKQFYSRTNDIFAKYDRAINLDYADDLKLKYFIWAHTVKDTSTEFCRRRSNQIYSREFADTWDATLNWKGKKPNNNIYTDGHGYNCRATLNFISDEVAEVLIKRRGVDKFNE